jgi:hypothetical protein
MNELLKDQKVMSVSSDALSHQLIANEQTLLLNLV